MHENLASQILDDLNGQSATPDHTLGRIYTVSELTCRIKEVLESEFPPMWLEAEISNFRKPASGHFYFTLKDAQSQISAIMYRSSAQRVVFKLEDGMKVMVYGRVSVYEKGGNYQIIATIIEPRGVGALQLAFEQLKKKLMEEGLFDKKYKKTIPMLPSRIGVVTSPTGAAIRDILNVINRRFSNIQLLIAPCRVQGDEAPAEIAQAIDELNRLNCVDVILVTRGGGSIEDLWAFNSELVARSIFRSNIPIISAVGHEIDWTIADYVADLRVPTPSAAAELVVGSKEEFISRIANFEKRLYSGMQHYMNILKNRVLRLSQSRVFIEPQNRIRQYQQQVDECELRINQSLSSVMSRRKHQLVVLSEKLHAFSPSSVMLRGFSITTKYGVEGSIKSVRQVDPGDRLKTYFSDGEISSTVDRVYFKGENK